MNRPVLRRPVLIAAGAATLVAMGGALATDLGPWYSALVLPPWKPPDWAFGPVWTLIFTLCAITGVRAWDAAKTSVQRTRVLWLFAVNGVLNVLWSLLFFASHRPDWGLWEVGPLWLSVLALIVGLRPIVRSAVALLLPYLIWVAVAAAMNLQIVITNPRFG
jgi:tryptophan-rich sensory protein